MIREGSYERVLGFLASNAGILDVSHVRDKSAQGNHSLLLRKKVMINRDIYVIILAISKNAQLGTRLPRKILFEENLP